jgi:plastocyanin
MPALLSKTVILLIPAAAGIGCGGSSPTTTDSELTTVEVTPASATLFTLSPANSVALSVVAKDQDGRIMEVAGATTFSSSDDAVAAVDAEGTVMAAAVGTTVITASVTADGITKSGTATVNVVVAPATADVQAPAFTYNPPVVDVAAGGSVTWTMAFVIHDVTFNEPNAPEDVPRSQSVSVSRAFPTPGVFTYRCTLHPKMAGSVRVH